MWDIFVYFLPSLLMLLVLFVRRWERIQHLADGTAHHMGHIAWSVVCRLLKLPCLRLSGASQPGIRLTCRPTALASHLKKHCNGLAKLPLARWPHGDPHLQIFYNLLWPTTEVPGVRFIRENLLVTDGGIVAMDWAVSRTQTASKRDHLGSSDCPPIVVVIPNALGRVTPHILKLCMDALRQGFSPMVFHRRGHGGCALTTPHYQEFGNPSDLVQVVAYLRSHHPSSSLFAVSEGSGSGLLLSYLGERGSSSYLVAAACISPVFHGQLWFEYKLPWVYQWIGLIYHKFQINRYATALSSVMNIAQILHCSSLRDLEELMFCAPRLLDHRPEDPKPSQKPDWVSYWERNEPLRDADEVAVPVLCLCSKDDPLLPPFSTVPEALFHNNPFFVVAVTDHGGHCGFLQEDNNGGITSWSHSVVLDYFKVVADFLGEEKNGFQDVVGHGGSGGLKYNASGIFSRRRRSAMLRRERLMVGPRRRQISASSDTITTEEEQVDFTWRRSYTR